VDREVDPIENLSLFERLILTRERLFIAARRSASVRRSHVGRLCLLEFDGQEVGAKVSEALTRFKLVFQPVPNILSGGYKEYEIPCLYYARQIVPSIPVTSNE